VTVRTPVTIASAPDFSKSRKIFSRARSADSLSVKTPKGPSLRRDPLHSRAGPGKFHQRSIGRRPAAADCIPLPLERLGEGIFPTTSLTPALSRGERGRALRRTSAGNSAPLVADDLERPDGTLFSNRADLHRERLAELVTA